MIRRRRFCPRCERYVEAIYAPPKFVLHALLVVLTCGLWFPIWFVAMSRSNAACPYCGRRL